MIGERSWGSILFDIVNYIVLGLLGLSCLLPLVHIAAVSLSGRAAAEGDLVWLWPIGFNIKNYEAIMKDVRFTRAFMTSVLRALAGTSVNLLIIVLSAYPLSLERPWRGRSVFRIYLLFAMLFSGGLIPTYMLIKSLGLLNNFWVLILPGAVPIWSIIIMTNFFRGIPTELAEAAHLDGASHWDILFRIFLPVSKPGLATLTLFGAVGHWNAWFDGLIYMNDTAKYPLQSYLQTVVIQGDQTAFVLDPEQMQLLSRPALRAAEIMVATIPILLLYPFLQRYFVTGLTLGSVKG